MPTSAAVTASVDATVAPFEKLSICAEINPTTRRSATVVPISTGNVGSLIRATVFVVTQPDARTATNSAARATHR